MQLTSFEIIVLILSILSILFQFFWIFYFLRKSILPSKTQNNNTEAVSIIIAAKNELENLKNLIPALLNQDYENFEIIIANDRSSDGTEEYLKELSLKNKNLNYINIKEESGILNGKKQALTQAIKFTKYEILLFTDADCIPSSKNWINEMTNALTDNKEIVLGYGGFFADNTWINSLIRYDALIIAMQYLGMAKAGLPYMGVGRNILYKKSLWDKQKGFESHIHIPYGDDDLFVMQSANSKNTSILLHPDAVCFSTSKSNFKEWSIQKCRHLKTAHKYKFSIIILLICEPLSKILIITGIIIFLICSAPLISLILFTVLILRSIIYYNFQQIFFNLTKENKIGIKSLIFDLTLPFIYLYLNIYKLFTKTNKSWK